MMKVKKQQMSSNSSTAQHSISLAQHTVYPVLILLIISHRIAVESILLLKFQLGIPFEKVLSHSSFLTSLHNPELRMVFIFPPITTVFAL